MHTPPATPVRRFLLLALFALYVGMAVACAHAKKSTSSTAATEAAASAEAASADPEVDEELAAWKYSTAFVNGKEMGVWWSDGDSFKFETGPYKGSGVRLQGYNTLESYGPVHRWGTWTSDELFDLARSSKKIGMEGTWTCTSNLDKDGYGRLLVDCPALAEAMIRAGHGHVFTMEGEGSEALLAAQKEAQESGAGMWAKGIPALIVTSLHSVEEGNGYNRRVDTATGVSTVRQHSDSYGVCEEVCEGPEGSQSCLTYIPYANRYKNKPDCLVPSKAETAAE